MGMKIIYCIKCNKHRKFKNTRVSHIFDKTLVLFLICDKHGRSDEKIFKEEEAIKIFKILSTIHNMIEFYVSLL